MHDSDLLSVCMQGWICLYTGLHLGTRPDETIWDTTVSRFPFLSWEWWIGDGAYVDCGGVATRYLQQDGKALWPWQPHA